MNSSCSRPADHLTHRDETGQTAVEYAMVMTLVGIVIAGVLALGAGDVFSAIWSAVTSAL